MVEAVQSWFKQNTGIVAILVGQTVALIGGIAYVVNWKADIESRVHILEERGSPHLSSINNRLTVTEKETEGNKARIDRIVEIMLRELPGAREKLK